MKILINSESLRPPLTGIGNYTLHLLQALQNLPEIQQLDCFNGHRITASQMAINANAIAPSKTTRNDGSQWQQKVRESIRALPLTYKLRAAWLDYKFEQLATQGQYNVYHEPNFILKNMVAQVSQLFMTSLYSLPAIPSYRACTLAQPRATQNISASRCHYYRL